MFHITGLVRDYGTESLILFGGSIIKMRFLVYSAMAASVLATCTGEALAATNFSYQKTIYAGTGGAISNRLTGMVGAPAGGLYVISSAVDRISYMPNPVDDSQTSLIVSSEPSYGTGNSLEGVSVTPNGTVYAGGKNTASESTYWKAIPDGAPATSFQATVLTNVNGLFTGPAAINNDTFVVSSNDDGSLTFLQNPSDATVNVLSPSISGGSAGAKSLVYDPVENKIYQAASVDASITGKITVFNTNGTPAGTSAGTVYSPGLPTTLPVTNQGMRYQSIAISPTARLLAVAVNTGTSGVNNTGWAIYSLVSNTQIDFITLGPNDVPDGTDLSGAAAALGPNQAQGCAFLEKNGSTYLILSTGNGVTPQATASRAYVFKQNQAGVSDWTIY